MAPRSELEQARHVLGIDHLSGVFAFVVEKSSDSQFENSGAKWAQNPGREGTNRRIAGE